MRAAAGMAVLAFAIGLVLVPGCARKAAKVEPQPVAPAPEPPPPPPPPEEKFETRDIEAELRALLEPIYFDYDRYNLRSDAIATLEKIAPFLAENTGIRLLIQGHADERGTDEYNMGLAENRARSARQYFEGYGLPSGRFEIVSYGKTRPVNPHCPDEACHARNRRVEWQVLAR